MNLDFVIKRLVWVIGLPKVAISELIGLMETLNSPEYKDKEKVDLPELADTLHLNVDDLFPITEALEILRFARVSKVILN